MAAGVFITAEEALKRYGKSDIRTLKSWARKGYMLYQVIGATDGHPKWLFESPEARYERLQGIRI